MEILDLKVAPGFKEYRDNRVSMVHRDRLDFLELLVLLDFLVHQGVQVPVALLVHLDFRGKLDEQDLVVQLEPVVQLAPSVNRDRAVYPVALAFQEVLETLEHQAPSAHKEELVLLVSLDLLEILASLDNKGHLEVLVSRVFRVYKVILALLALSDFLVNRDYGVFLGLQDRLVFQDSTGYLDRLDFPELLVPKAFRAALVAKVQLEVLVHSVQWVQLVLRASLGSLDKQDFLGTRAPLVIQVWLEFQDNLELRVLLDRLVK